ncbi:MAG: 4Fe-4S dicluster domain-containing protein [Planctomycetota bacterium]|jgi:Pyruvate/2-oxoacid:ferredoxin oxidoreductase delta subunit
MSDQAYRRIAENVDRGFQTAPKTNGELSTAFVAYLKLLYTPEQAELVQHLPMPTNAKTVEDVAEASGRPVEDVEKVLLPLAERGFLTPSKRGYALPAIPNLVNLHMFYPEMKPDDLEAAKLYQQFFIKEKFYKYYGTSAKGTPALRSIPVEQAIHAEEKTFSAEEAHAYIKGLQTEDLALVPCPCRTRTEKLEIRECSGAFPVGACIFIGKTAVRFEELGLGKRVSKEQAIDYLDEMVALGLVATAENYLADPHSIMCLCCGCCCSNLRGRTRWDNPTAVLPSHFLPEASDECVLCGTCVERCMLEALSLDEEAERSVANPEKCIGCGICTITCPTDALKLHRFERPSAPFANRIEFGMTVARDNDRL